MDFYVAFFLFLGILAGRSSENQISNCSYYPVNVKIGYCVTCNVNNCEISIGICRFFLEVNVHNQSNITFNDVKQEYEISASSCQELNDAVCAPFNREGFFCSKCKPGYGPPMYSTNLKCEKCHDDKHSGWLWLLYLLLELVPLTVFYFLVIIFNIRATAPPFTAFIFFCQLFGIIFQVNPYFKFSVDAYSNNVFFSIVSIVLNIWNLDIFRYIIPSFCVSTKLTDLHILLLEYTSALYPLFLVVITYVGIELHGRNLRIIIIVWKPFHKCFAHLRRSVDSRSSVIAAFSTFLSLSFSRILYITCLILSPGEYWHNGIGREYISRIDPHINASSESQLFHKLIYTWYSVPLLTITVLTYIPIILLLLYPIKCFRKLLSYCGPKKYHAIYVFIDTFQGHYNDGTNGTRDYRAASCMSFALRIPAYIIITRSTSQRQHVTDYLFLVQAIMITSLFYAIAHPCKKKYANIFESLLYFAAGLILTYFSSIHVHLNQGHIMHNRVIFNFYLMMLIMPSLILICSFVNKKVKQNKCFKFNKLSSPNVNDFPDRMVNPLIYGSLS